MYANPRYVCLGRMNSMVARLALLIFAMLLRLIAPAGICQARIEPRQALRLAREWIAARSSHDLDRILLHYSEGFETTPPALDACGEIVRAAARHAFKE